MSGLALRNPKVQRLRRLIDRRAERSDARAFVVEGPTVLQEALTSGAIVQEVFHAPGAAAAVVEAARSTGADVHELAAGVLERVATTVAPQGVVAVVAAVDVTLDTLSDATLLAVCVGVADPGNAGTIVRAAGAAGGGGVVFCDGSVDVYNPKTVRATAGSLFHVPVVVGGDAVKVLGQIGGWGMRRLAASAHGGRPHTAADLRTRVCIVLGNESGGLPASVDPVVDEHLTIPLAGASESLNVAMAASVLLFEAARQRSAA